MYEYRYFSPTFSTNRSRDFEQLHSLAKTKDIESRRSTKSKTLKKIDLVIKESVPKARNPSMNVEFIADGKQMSLEKKASQPRDPRDDKNNNQDDNESVPRPEMKDGQSLINSPTNERLEVADVFPADPIGALQDQLGRTQHALNSVN